MSGVHVVVLAAGVGSRIQGRASGAPKWLLEVAGESPARRHLAALEGVETRRPGLLRSVHVVTGHAAASIEQLVADQRRPAVTVTHNPRYADLNNWYSLLLALRVIGELGSDRVVLLNADFFAPSVWIEDFIVHVATTAAPAVMALDTQRPLTEESMKVATKRNDGGVRVVTGIGKVGVVDPTGEYVGMLMFSGLAEKRLRASLEDFGRDPDRRNEWYEGAIRESLRDADDWEIWPTPSTGWVEIDTDADLDAAIAIAEGDAMRAAR